MANDIENALKSTAQKIAQYVDDIATMEVKTYYVVVGAEGNQEERLGASTVVKLDGDSSSVVPIRSADAGAGVDTDLFDVHQRNVATAIEYRARMLASLLEALKSYTGR